LFYLGSNMVDMVDELKHRSAAADERFAYVVLLRQHVLRMTFAHGLTRVGGYYLPVVV